MPVRLNIIGIDGHDGSGKTTLAKLLAERIAGSYVRPFGGEWGEELMAAYQSGAHDRILDIGESAIRQAIEKADQNHPIVLDRSWMTVGSLVPSPLFSTRWSLWIPSVLCWSDLSTTLTRLSTRYNEEVESREWHEHFLAIYRDLADAKSAPILRTDKDDIETTVKMLLVMANQISES